MRLVLAPALGLLALGGLACGTVGAPEPVPAIDRPSPQVVRLALGASFSCALGDDAAVRCWGDLPREVAGHDIAERLRAPHTIARMTNVHEIAASHDTLCARTSERRVLCWGPDVHGDGEAQHPVEIGALHGATSIAAPDGRVCALVAGELRCSGTNQPRVRELLPSGAWLEAVGDVVCALDGRGPARCLEPGTSTLWSIEGSEGAVSIAIARGVCATTADGHLRCDALAEHVNDASLVEVEGVDDATLVRGTRAVRCVASREGGVVCSRQGGEDVVFEGAADSLAVGAPHDLGHEDDGQARWHACVLEGEAISCAGVDEAGEVSMHAPELVQRIHEVEGARFLLVGARAACVVGGDGTLIRVPFGEPSAVTQDASARSWLERFPFDAERLCRSVLDAEPIDLSPEREARNLADIATSDASRALVWFEDRPCALRDGVLACDRGSREGERFVPLPGWPSDLERVFAGAEQLFAMRRGGQWLAMGHNGVGQLGLAPSRPIETPAVASMGPFTHMAFAYHLSCGWNDEGPLVCAGLDDNLRPRALSSGYSPFETVRPPDRGDGLWRPIPRVSDVTVMGSNGMVSCAIDARGGLWCWGGLTGGAGPRTLPPTRVPLLAGPERMP
ncbi:MAG: hypothetical protein J0L92_17910 [Deltaproteobacteria bacterium]|nr:hypothetical protein [Deltaproteobacteria bacterium]